MDSNNILQEEFDKNTERLRLRLDNGEKVENLTSAPEWEWYAESLTKTLERTKDTMASATFINDHNGYIYAAAQAMVIKNLLENIERMKKQYRDAAARLNEMEASNDL